jgi:hypothetical protein
MKMREKRGEGGERGWAIDLISYGIFADEIFFLGASHSDRDVCGYLEGVY